MENGNFYQKVKDAKKEEEARLNDLKWAMERARKENSWNVAGMYHDFGSFCVRDITDAFAVLLTYIEGEKFIPYRDFINTKINEGSIIIKDDVNKKYDRIDYDTLHKLYENGDLIQLDNGFSNIVSFYNYIGEPNYRFGQMDYLREFVDQLIQYRMENNKRTRNDITMEELYSFICTFLSSYPDLAQKNKEKREQWLIEQIEEDPVTLECKKLEIGLKNNCSIVQS